MENDNSQKTEFLKEKDEFNQSKPQNITENDLKKVEHLETLDI